MLHLNDLVAALDCAETDRDKALRYVATYQSEIATAATTRDVDGRSLLKAIEWNLANLKKQSQIARTQQLIMDYCQEINDSDDPNFELWMRGMEMLIANLTSRLRQYAADPRYSGDLADVAIEHELYSDFYNRMSAIANEAEGS